MVKKLDHFLFKGVFVLAMVFWAFGATGQSEQNPKEDEVDEFEEAPAASQEFAHFDFEADRKVLLEKLKNEIEPNLLPGDISRITRNVMRLGSYRLDWVQ